VKGQEEWNPEKKGKSNTLPFLNFSLSSRIVNLLERGVLVAFPLHLGHALIDREDGAAFRTLNLCVLLNIRTPK